MTGDDKVDPESPEEKLRKAAEALGKVVEKLGPAGELIERGSRALFEATAGPSALTAPSRPKPPADEERRPPRLTAPTGSPPERVFPFLPPRDPGRATETPARAPAPTPVPLPPTRPTHPGTYGFADEPPPRKPFTPPPGPPERPTESKRGGPPSGPPARDEGPPEKPGGKPKAAKPTRLEKVWKATKPLLLKTRAGQAVAGFASRVRRAGRAGGKITKAAGLGKGIGAGAGKAVPIVGALAAAGKAVYDFGKAVAAAADGALDAQRKYAEVSGSQAAIFANLDVKQLMRDVKHGEATAGSTGKLAESVDARREQSDRVAVVLERIENTILAKFNDLITPIVEGAADILEALEKLNPFAEEKKKPAKVGVAGEMAAGILERQAAIDRAAKDAMARAKEANRRPPGFSRPGG